MTPQEEKEAAARERKAEVNNAWQRLALSPDFKLVFEKDIQIQYNPLAPSFLEKEDFNPYAAACRDGSRQVISHIHRRLVDAKKATEQD